MEKQYQLLCLVTVALCGIILSGCQAGGGVKTEPVSAVMPAYPVKPNAVGYTRTTKSIKGKVNTTKLVSVEGDLYNFESSSGATWTNYANPILPSPQWTAEEWGTGSQRLENVKGAMFPLEVGNKMSFNVVGESTKYPDGWRENRKCEVVAQELVTVEAGDFDAFKVVCNDQWRKRTWYFSPAVNDIVWSRSIHKENPEQNSGWELTTPSL